MTSDEDSLKKLYLSVAEEYNATPLAVQDGWIYEPSAFGFLQLQQVIAALPVKGVLLDIGTGRAIIPRCAKRLGHSVITLDSEDCAGSSAVDNARLAGIEGHFGDCCADPLPCADNSVDCVLFADVIEHLLHSPRPVLNEIKRVLKPGGVCISTTPNALRLTTRLKVMAGYSNWANLREYFDTNLHVGHHHEYTIEEFRWVFEQCGFEVQKLILDEYNLKAFTVTGTDSLATQHRAFGQSQRESLVGGIARKLLVAMTSIMPSLRSQMIVYAQKPLSSVPVT